MEEENPIVRRKAPKVPIAKKSAKTKKRIMPTKKQDAPEAPREPNEKPAIVAPAKELIDSSSLDEADRIRSLANLLKILPKQYYEDTPTAKDNLWAILRFVPTDEQMDLAKKVLENESKRTP